MMAILEVYYIYYEKNSQMQTYMIERSQKEPEITEKWRTGLSEISERS